MVITDIRYISFLWQKVELYLGSCSIIHALLVAKLVLRLFASVVYAYWGTTTLKLGKAP